MNLVAYALSPFICALIGWLTNYLAVKMLFHPKTPVRLGPLALHGVFPKRQKALADKLGRVIERELVNGADIACELKNVDFSDAFREELDGYVDSLLRDKLTKAVPMAAMFLSDETVAKIKKVLVPEMEKMIPHLVDKAACEIEDQLDVGRMVRDKVESFSSDKLEEILLAVMKREFRFIEIVGGVLGFLIGLFQALFFYLAGQ